MAAIDEKQLEYSITAEKVNSNESLGLTNAKTAQLADAVQHNTDSTADLTIWEAIKIYKPALGYCFIFICAVISEGYDTNLLSNFFAYPSFLIKYGKWVGITDATPVGYQLEAGQQAGLSQGGGAGSIVGCLLCGYLVSKYGSRMVTIGALVAFILAVFPVFFAPNIPVLIVGEVLCGITWGILATSAPAYSSEVLPPQLRTYVASAVNMSFITGQLISAGILKGLSARVDEWGYKIPFALQWVAPVILIPFLYWAPESPYYLARMGRMEEAEHSLRRLQAKDTYHKIDPKATLATIVYTDNLEKQLSIGTSYFDCFKGAELRRTEIACMVFAGQILSGICMAYNSSYFFSQIGLGTSATYSLALGGTAMALVACVVQWFAFMPYFGRRTIYIWGLGGMFSILCLIGVLNIWTHIKAVALSQACLTLLWTVIFQLSIGQLGWALPAEVGSSRLRQKTICLARDASNITGLIGGTLQQYFMSPTAWNLKGYTAFIWAFTCGLTFIWAFFRLPETKDRPYHELDILFARRVPARKFATTEANAFDGSTDDLVTGAAKEAAKEAVRSGSVALPSHV